MDMDLSFKGNMKKAISVFPSELQGEEQGKFSKYAMKFFGRD